mmetsp:Transcript_48516/g.103238  ORF Transcript_48516/g.103238 Transcript_48516/m.103238 type:complete len:96 (+) Transcript_48516:349-636(+)
MTAGALSLAADPSSSSSFVAAAGGRRIAGHEDDAPEPPPAAAAAARALMLLAAAGLGLEGINPFALLSKDDAVGERTAISAMKKRRRVAPIDLLL